jgi:hypothetical protein
MAAIHNFVQKAMKWNGKYGVYTNGTTRKAYEEHTGNAAEINLLLTSMMQEAGFNAAPVLVSTREYGRVHKGSPMLSKFNYVIAHVQIGDKEYLLDATEPLLPAGALPLRCMNGEGRLIDEKDQRWVALNPTSPFTKFFNAELTINKNGEMKGTGKESVGGYNALYLRKAILEEGEAKYAERIGKETGNFKIGKPTITNLTDVNTSLNISYDISASGSGPEEVNVIYLNPMLGHGEKENPFKLMERTYPVDFGAPMDETYICRFTIPAGYEMEEAPKSVAVTLPENGGRFMYMVQKEGNTIQVMSKVSISKPVYYAPEYPYLKEFYSQIVAKHAEQIVLKKVAAN